MAPIAEMTEANFITTIAFVVMADAFAVIDIAFVAMSLSVVLKQIQVLQLSPC